MHNRPKVFFRGLFLDAATVVLPTQKFACVISKKTLKQAVKRNNVKRRIFNIIKMTQKKFKLSVIFYPKKTSITAQHQKLKEEILQAFATLH